MSDSVPPAPGGSTTRRVASATFLGTTLEWYDFYLYGAAAALVFGPQYFPDFSPAAATLASFATFAVGFLARPIGGILFGHLGDRWGRKRALISSMMVMGVGTFLIALLPTYAHIGILAPVLLVLLRLVQGLGVGGEWGGAVLMAIEHAPPRRRAFYSVFPQMGNPAGIVLANLVFLVVGATTAPETFAAWGWRIPFLLSALLVVVALVARLRLDESPEFRATAKRGTVRRMPIVDVLRAYPGRVLLGMSVSFAPSAIGYFFSVYLLSYGTGQVGFPRQTLLTLVTVAAVLVLVVTFVAGRSADRVGPGRVFLAAMAAAVLAVSVSFLLFDTAAVPAAFIALLLIAVPMGLAAGVQAILVAEAFPAAVRYSAASLAFQLGAVLGGGLTPLLATVILTATGSSVGVVLYLAALCVVSALGVVFLQRSARGRREGAPQDEPNTAADRTAT